MADWYYIETEFTATPDPAEEAECRAELLELDYDWPGFSGNQWRSPLIEDGILAKVLVRHGYRGNIWLTQEDNHRGPPIVLDPKRAWDEEIEKEKADMRRQAVERIMKKYREVHEALGIPVAEELNESLFLLLGGWRDLFEAARESLTTQD